MERLASFVRSDDGQFYAAVCDRYGVDPGAITDDEHLAFNIRAGLLHVEAKRRKALSENTTQGGIVTDLAERMAAGGV